MTELTHLTACAAVDLLERREVSPLELVEAAAARIAATDGAINALPTLCLDRARDHAKRLMRVVAAVAVLLKKRVSSFISLEEYKEINVQTSFIILTKISLAVTFFA